MHDTLVSLANLFIEAIPTVIFFVILTVFLKQTYFKPMAKVLEERRRQTEGARELAQRAFDAAEGKQAEFERALQEARNQLYSEHDALRCQWEDEQAQMLAKARAEADEQLKQAKQDIAAQVEAAETELQAQVDELGQQIATSILRGRAA